MPCGFIGFLCVLSRQPNDDEMADAWDSLDQLLEPSDEAPAAKRPASATPIDLSSIRTRAFASERPQVCVRDEQEPRVGVCVKRVDEVRRCCASRRRRSPRRG